jgi:hypothetical protein
MSKRPPFNLRPRPRRRNLFTERDVARAVRAARRAGGVARIEISSDNGTITLLLGEPSDNSAALPSSTDLDRWLANKDKDARPA